MSTMSLPALDAVKEAILQKLAEEPLRPTDLLRALERFDDLEVRQALSQLNQDGRVEFTSERRFAVKSAA